ncbi:hypothetical protein RMSM_01632 [Rhodopirellula maiorica SM1]|uniref:Uncharacterized protein n=1 Tax=Rhodopirellula maiorica SM1 TaxID=1265738 RepID=M5RQG2_9BACT|nr:hypothetical protein [Rhodopirellula maiorica]EMI21446.1 hypothetical protein RMSM_01632 [Rhodopirellula maiorica SM1]
MTAWQPSVTFITSILAAKQRIPSREPYSPTLLSDFAMNPSDRHEQIRSLFNQAVNMEDTERRWFLHSIDDRDLAADVERLLESSACCGTFRDKNKDSDRGSC